jgi:hypothetical protein
LKDKVNYMLKKGVNTDTWDFVIFLNPKIQKLIIQFGSNYLNINYASYIYNLLESNKDINIMTRNDLKHFNLNTKFYLNF